MFINYNQIDSMDTRVNYSQEAEKGQGQKWKRTRTSSIYYKTCPVIGIYTIMAMMICPVVVLETTACEINPNAKDEGLRDLTVNDWFSLTAWLETMSKPSSDRSPVCNMVVDNQRFDCNPDEPTTEKVCLSRGCCWQSNQDSTSKKRPNVPACFFPENYVGYNVADVRQDVRQAVVTLKRNMPSGFDDINTVEVVIRHINDKQLRISFYDANARRYEVPIPKLNLTQKRSKAPSYNVKISSDGHLIVRRMSTGTKVFDTDLKRLVYSKQFLQLSSSLPTERIFGIGEQEEFLQKKAEWRRYTLFNYGRDPVVGQNLYGSHPFHMSVEDDAANSHGVFLFNSNAMDIILQPTPAITWRTIGGILDFFIFFGPDVQQVVRQYQNLVGLPHMPPFWSLGFHLSRYGYGSLGKTMDVWKRTRDAGIPFDVQWNDIDYMDRRNDFTYDKVRFAGLPEFVDKLHGLGMHYVAIFDAGIGAGQPSGTYAPFDDGRAMDIFIKNYRNRIFRGHVWNDKYTVWPDFLHPLAVTYWSKQFELFHKVIKYDGAWIDMNEPTNFLNGEGHGCLNTSINFPQYRPGDVSLSNFTICMNAKHYSGIHYDLHNLYGLAQTIATNAALKTVRQKRPFVISRSTYSGQGHFGGHWTGDVFSRWDDFGRTIPGILSFNIFGIPLVGSDICGFHWNTTAELCARWSTVGAFYPFARNHNDFDTIEQDPVSLGPTVVAANIYALTIRYMLLPFLYTLFHRAHIFGETVARPLFFEFPLDKRTYSIESQFMWGSAIMIIPVLEPNATAVNGYFPKARWYDFMSRKSIVESNGEYKELDTPLDKINVAIRGGSILAILPAKQTTTELRKGKFSFLIALNEYGKASGELYWDDGDSLDTMKIGKYSKYKFSVENNRLTANALRKGYDCPMPIGNISVLGLRSSVTRVCLNEKETEFALKNDANTLDVEVNVDMNNFVSLNWS